MNWKEYSHLENTHAFLSPSKHYWLNYSPEKLASSYETHKKASLGTQYHKLAAELITLAVRLPNTSATFNSFVNDAIGFKMKAEVVLFHSYNCYGTTDAISFYNGVLRIHDLKTGRSPGSINQLLIYAGLFILDYVIDYKEIKETHLRIYQNEEVLEFSPSALDITDVVSRIEEADKIIENINADNVL
jgi:hypothetical protein